MAAQYLIRIDDVCPTMNWENFLKLKNILEKHNLTAILGVIPKNKDPKLMQYKPEPFFWNEIKSLSQKGWPIAQHGFEHLYITSNSGILGINNKSEFAGLTYEIQKSKISQGKAILENKLSQPIKWWMAPAHSFDTVTCRVLAELGFTHITDGIALTPIRRYGLIWIPQQIWKPKKKLFGLWTICIHPESISLEYLDQLTVFLAKEHEKIVSFSSSFIPKTSALNTVYYIWWNFQFYIYKHFLK